MNSVAFPNPCNVKIYKGVTIQDNNYKKYTSLSSEELKKIIHHQGPSSYNYYKDKLNKEY